MHRGHSDAMQSPPRSRCSADTDEEASRSEWAEHQPNTATATANKYEPAFARRDQRQSEACNETPNLSHSVCPRRSDLSHTSMQRLRTVLSHCQPTRASAAPALFARRMSSAAPTAAAAAEEPAPVRITPHGNGCTTLSLHRAKALNALNLPMIRLLTSGLSSQQASPPRRCVLVYGEGEKAFCAGGDIRALAYPAHPSDPYGFFREEYRLNHLIHESARRQPYIAIMRGIVMGGGVGISVHGSHRVVTDSTMFAMPETGIGLFPDVGGSWFLPRLPGSIGMFLALTGQALGARDTIYAGVGTHYVPQASIPALITELESTPDLARAANASAAIESLLSKFACAPPADKPDAKLKAFLESKRTLIDRVFSADSYDAVLARLSAEIARSDVSAEDKSWLESVQKSLSTKSPTSLLITFHAMQLGATLPSLRDCLTMELRLGTRITTEGQKGGDFAEGVKAIVVDKKHKPVWAPKPTMQQIKDKYFAPFTKEEGLEEFTL